MNLKIIVATDENNGIGKNNTLPWKYSEDLKYFPKKTKGNNDYSNAVIMGRKTYESIGKPLSGRMNYVLSKTKQENQENLFFFNNYKSLLESIKIQNFNEVWIIGGEKIYKLFLDLDIVSEVYVTKIKGNYDCDVFFPLINSNKNNINKFYIDKGWPGISSELEFVVYKHK